MQLNAKHERGLIILVALHSYSIGLMFFLVPGWTVRFAGWNEIEPLFFAHQAAAFHVALASAYLIEYFRYRGIAVLVTAKSVALVFLLMSAVFSRVPWAVPFSGLADGAMALVVVLVHRSVRTTA